MAVTQEDVRRICAQLPGAIEGDGRFGFSVEVKGKSKGFLWSWSERVEPRKPRVINDGVLAIVVPNLAAKELLMQSDDAMFVVDPHYNGFPAVLVRLDAVDFDELEDLVVEAWKSKAPPALIRQFEQGQNARS